MAQDLTKLASQGRAYSASRAWNAEELKTLLAIEASGDGVSRIVAAEYIRNGITSVEEYEAAIEAEFVPKSFADVQSDAVNDHVKNVRKELGLETEEEDKKTAEELAKEEADIEAAKVAFDALPEEEQKAITARRELEAKAVALGIKVQANMKDATLEKKIAEHVPA